MKAYLIDLVRDCRRIVGLNQATPQIIHLLESLLGVGLVYSIAGAHADNRTYRT